MGRKQGQTHLFKERGRNELNKGSKPRQKPFRLLITLDPADHRRRRRHASQLQSIIDLSECAQI